MSTELLINVTPSESRVALIENGVLQEIQLERIGNLGIVGNIYLGKISRVLPGMQAAFVDIGLEKAAFLHASDIVNSASIVEGVDDVPIKKVQDIRELVRQGQYIMVQVVKDPLGTKGKKTSKASILHEDLTLAFRTLRDYVGEDMERIRVDSKLTHEELKLFTEEFVPQLSQVLEYYPGERPIFDLFDVENEIQKALHRKVTLKSGGYIIIDQTEAMTTVDVNTGAFVGHRNLEETIFNTNVEATSAIARQLRLRNLGGIIIIDFIDMVSEDHKRRVLHSLESALAKDRTKTNINGLSALGLVEMTRKRTRESLEHILCDVCPACSGRGSQKTVETVCYEILREIVRVNRAYAADKFMVYAAPAVSEALLNDEYHNLAELELFIGKQVNIQTESLYSQEQFDVVMM